MKRLVKLTLNEITVEYKPKSLTKVSRQPNILKSEDAVRAFYMLVDKTAHATCENIYALFLTSTNQPLGYTHLGRGSARSCTMNMRLLAQAAILSNAIKVILIHNHPSGSLSFSDGDYQITKTTRDALALFDIELLDHIVTACGRYVSMRTILPKEKLKEYFGRGINTEPSTSKKKEAAETVSQTSKKVIDKTSKV